MSGTPASLLLESLRVYLREEVQPQLSGFSAYTNRVATNLVAILERETVLGERRLRLDRAFARRRELPEDDLQRSLSLGLRDGSQPADRELMDYLRRRTLLSMAIDNPRYSGYRTARERWPELEAPP